METRLFFPLDLKDLDLRSKVKGIENRRWHGGQKKWSIPDTAKNRQFLKDHGLVFSIHKTAVSPPPKKMKKPMPRGIELPEDIVGKITEMRQWMEQQRYSYSTIKTYISFVRKFFVFYRYKGWNKVNRQDIRDYNFQEFIKKGMSYSAQNQFINAIKLFYSLHRNGEIIPEDIKRPRKQTRLPNVLSKEEVARIISSVGNLKHKCLLMVVYGAGLRIGEALNLRVEDIRSKEKLIYIRQSKGAKDRRVPLSEKMLQILRDYFKAYRPRNYLFEGQNGGKYSATSARNVFRRACQKAGISIKVTLHTLRHSYATHLMESGVGLRYIQEILGHNSPKTTMMYTRISGKRLSEIRSPLEDMDL